MLEENGTVSAVIHGNDGLTDIGDTASSPTDSD